MPQKTEQVLERLIFASRWVQAPMYAGLIVASVVYAAKFMIELWHLVSDFKSMTESEVMLLVLGLVDFTMVANLLVMVIIGGYATFVSRLELGNHPDRPDWLEHIGAGTLKVKLAASLAGVSGIHLLKAFIQAKEEIVLNASLWSQPLFWQVIIHLVFLVSTIMLARADQMLQGTHAHPHKEEH